MNISWSMHIVKKGDTLESVAQKLGISSQTLRQYHNTYCDLKEIIEENHLKGISAILLPSSQEIQEFKEFEKKNQTLNSLPLHYLPHNFYKPSYNIEETIESSAKAPFTVSYKATLKTTREKEGIIVSLANSYFQKEEETPEDKISTLAIACMNTIYPIEFIINSGGQIINIKNHQEIINKFKERKLDLLTYFSGKINQAYIDKFEKTLTDRKKILKSYCSTLLYQVLFPNMSWFSEEEKNDFFYYQANSYNVESAVITQHNFENTDYIKTIVTSNYEEGSTFEEILRKKIIEYSHNTIDTQEEDLSNWQGSITFIYYTSKKEKQLLKVEAELKIENNQEIYLKHTLKIN
ncbi:LysM peptidoglycan-binding domain-containing protein [Flavobacterium columnare]|uniref:LysM domain protein n=2 Tax=Flavobacterium TaxID=237 RepID=A0A2N9PD27_9FLAO|nr:LysM peptidoglycan-binding domain-containing protein [Flavobacterium columnare]RVU90364.1 LysM peptidoglycan-binding domain-containing protein [Flavobacterium columnare]SPE78255.1 LysM domain protein [Flavobacterium columnare]